MADTALPRKKKPFLSPAFVRAMLAGHSALGLAFCALIYAVCLSGTLTVFYYEFARWEQPQGPVVGAVTTEAVTHAVNTVYQRAQSEGAAHSLFVTLPGHLSPWFNANYYGEEEGQEGNLLLDANGDPVRSYGTPWGDFLIDLHVYLHLPPTWGIFLVGLVGVTLLSSVISGILSHPRIFKDAFALRWGGSRRLQEADLHNRLSVWGLPFHIAISLTGALLGLTTVIVGILAAAAYDGDMDKAYAAFLGPQATESHTPAPIPRIEDMMAQIHATKPEAVLSGLYIDHVGTDGQLITLEAGTSGHLTNGERYSFDAKGQLISDVGYEDGSIGQQILGALQPLHFGWFGGILVKLAYGALGLALTVITTSGVMIWLSRRRDKGRPAPGWERVWAAMVWSQPLALAATAAAALLIDEAWLLTIYLLGLLASATTAALIRDGAAVSQALRWAGAVAIAGTALVHVIVWGTRIADPMAWYVDLVLVAAAATLIWPLMRIQRAKAAANASILAPAE